VTIVMMAIGLVALISMLALAIDVVDLYVSAGEAQKAADAAALAGAKVFVSSGFTSWQLGDPDLGVTQAIVCNGSTGLSDLQAQAAATQNFPPGTAFTATTSCTFPKPSPPENPQITVTVNRTGLPTFFARIWGATANSLSVRAKAEAYNPSGDQTPIQVKSVKPWLIPNCDPTTTPPAPPPPCLGNPYFVDSKAGKKYALNNPTNYIGKFFAFTQTKTPITGGYYAIDPMPQATVCPSSSAQPAGSCSQLTSSPYHDNIACANTATLTCGDKVNVSPNTGTLGTSTTQGTQCLIHTVNKGNPPPPPNSCAADTDPDCFIKPTVSGSPVSINGGQSNPDSNMQGTANISRSDSVVTVPIFDFQKPADDPCFGGVCGQATVVGFLQLGIQSVSLTGPVGTIGAVVLNAAGCDPAGSGNPHVSGGGVSPIPVRLD
jgi:Putative Flp pilus-assembly TadE/G-like